jgi:hypothetical protein
LVFDAQGTETLLRRRGTALYRFPLLPPPATAGYGACAKPFNIYSHEKKNEKLDYMHANPVKRGLVMEQLVDLLQKGTGAGAHRYREFMTDQKCEEKRRLTNRGRGTPELLKRS